MNNSEFEKFSSSIYKGYFAQISLAVISFLSFVMIALCVGFGAYRNDLNNTQSIFLTLGVISGMVIIYFGLCYTVGVKKSREYTDNIVKIINLFKPKEDGIVDKLLSNKLMVFFLGLSIFSILTIATWYLSKKYIL